MVKVFVSIAHRIAIPDVRFINGWIMFWSKSSFWWLWICCAMPKMCNVYSDKCIGNLKNWSKKPISRLSMYNHSLHLWQVSKPKSHLIENRFVIELMSFVFQKEIHHCVHFPHVMRLTIQMQYKISIGRGFNTWSSSSIFDIRSVFRFHGIWCIFGLDLPKFWSPWNHGKISSAQDISSKSY